MSLTVTHPFVSLIADSGNTSLVQPSDWNDDHTVVGDATATTGYVLVGQGAGSAPIWSSSFPSIITFPDGAVGAPGIAFTNQTTTGFYRIGSGNVGLSLAGTLYYNFNTTSFSPGANDQFSLGVSGTAFADLFLATGAVINFGAGNYVLTHSAGNLVATGGPFTAPSFIPSSSTVPTNGMYLPAANTIGWAINSTAELQLTASALAPSTTAGLDLGTTSLFFGTGHINAILADGSAGRTWQINRATTGAGQQLIISAGGAQSGATDTAGGGLRLRVGVSTGTANTATAAIQLYKPGASGSSDNSIYNAILCAYTAINMSANDNATAWQFNEAVNGNARFYLNIIPVGAVNTSAGYFTFYDNYGDGSTGSAKQGYQQINGIATIIGGMKRVSSDFAKTSDTTLANITGLSINAAASRTYLFEAILYTTSNVAGGVKFAIAGTATATSIVYQAVLWDGVGTATAVGTSRAAALATTVGDVTAVTTAYVRITGTITVNAAGTLTVQFAQNASNGAASTVLRGSTFNVWEVV